MDKEQKKVIEKARKPINKGQLAVLKLLFQYRFITTERLAKIEQQKHVAVSRSRLNILYEQGYVGRNYDNSYKLRGKFATYYLLPKGIKALKASLDVHPKAIKAIYNDKTASDNFIASSLTILDVSLKFKDMYGDTLQAFTRAELAEYDYFPQPTPDLYVSLKGKQASHYFVDVYSETVPLFVMVRKIKTYVSYEESGEWDATGSEFPRLLVICASDKAQAKLRKRLTPLLIDEGPDIKVFTTTVRELLLADSLSKVYRVIDI